MSELSKQVLVITVIIFSFFFTSWVSVMNAQEMKDILRKRIRESLITPDAPPLQHPLFQIGPQRQKEEVLKVSPTTRLPTKYDRILIMPKPPEMTIHMRVIPTNASPINMRLIGSAEHVQFGTPWRIYNNPGMHPAPGMLVVPSGISFDPSYGRAERRRERTDRLVKAYNNE